MGPRVNPSYSLQVPPKSQIRDELTVVLPQGSFGLWHNHQLQNINKCSFTLKNGDSLVAWWSRVSLPMQETPVWSLVQEDPTNHGTTKSVHANHWACAIENGSQNCWSPLPLGPFSATWAATAMRSPRMSTRELPVLVTTREEAGNNKDPAQPRINKFLNWKMKNI